jgi:general secretion pathway protein A
MYTSFFGLHERPFTITPDPRYLFMSERHAEALAHLIYGVTESDGFIQLTGEVGTGKTTLVRSVLQKLPAEADVALVLNPQLTALEFLRVICQELAIELPAQEDSPRALIDSLNHYLLDAHARGRRTILIVDEAQNLSAEVLEQVRLLTNLETSRRKLLQIILIGQPELRELLARNDLRQLAQRVTGRYHLTPLDENEALRYLEHRLSVAGAVQPIFTTGAKKAIFRISRGIPRLMNVVADRALLGAYAEERRSVDKRVVRRAAAEVTGQTVRETSAPMWFAAAASVAAVAVTAWWFTTLTPGKSMPIAAATTAPANSAGPIERVVERPAEPSRALPAESPPEPVSEPVELTAPAEPTLSELLQTNRDRTGTDDAFASLFRLWNLTFQRGRAGCEQAEAAGLRCVFDQASLAMLAQLDRPAILTLRDNDGEAYQVVLAGMDGARVGVDVGEQRFWVPRDQLADMWLGQYLLLWQPPNNTVQAFTPGMRSPGILWLRQTLTAIQGKPLDPTDSDLFDADVEARVREYQRARRLSVDGLVGQRTQILMNSDLGVQGIPKLSNVIPAAARVESNAGRP